MPAEGQPADERRKSLMDAFNGYFIAIDVIVGLFHDASQGFHHNHDFMARAQQQTVSQGLGPSKAPVTIEELDAKGMSYGNGPPGSGTSLVVHTTTQGAFKERNAKGGLNEQVMAELCIVMLYQYWEDHFRGDIASAAGVSHNDIAAPVLGELRHLRRSIVHNGSVAVAEVANNTLLPRFDEGANIVIAREGFDRIVVALRDGLVALARTLLGEDVKMRPPVML